ncbi:KilA-N domain-containing protein [Candidatus Halobeggiatoa sp. HSG11]|nr:KilA-N domain-containing protein [Candidatus Halobeggiatoa sp. HSG11]
MTTQLINRDFHGAAIRQRSDGYLNATDMCKATGKKFKDYQRNKTTQEFFIALSNKLEMPIKPQRENSPLGENKGLIEITRGGNYAGTWVHSKLAIHLAIWCNPEFAVMVTEWTYELLTKGSVSLDPKQEIATFAQIKAAELDKLGIVGNARQIALNNSIKQQFNCDMLKIFGIESQPAEIQQALLIPSDIAERTGFKNARPVNLKLIELGLQTKHRDHKNRIYYQLTEKGHKYAQYQDSGVRTTTIRAIKWYETVLKFFQALPVPKILKLI